MGKLIRESPSNVQFLGGGRPRGNAQVEGSVCAKIPWLAYCITRRQFSSPLATADGVSPDGMSSGSRSASFSVACVVCASGRAPVRTACGGARRPAGADGHGLGDATGGGHLEETVRAWAPLRRNSLLQLRAISVLLFH